MAREGFLGLPRRSNALDDMDFNERVERSLMAARRVDESTGCWLWTGCRLPTGHGQIRILGKGYLTHRLAAMLWLSLDIENRAVGSRKSRTQVNHKPECGNASCFNPAHLYIGDQKENINDIPDGKRGMPPRTHCKRGHEFTPETYSLRRGCFICSDAREAKWRAEHRDLINARQQAKRALEKEQRTRKVA